jgi:hypothetical protein
MAQRAGYGLRTIGNVEGGRPTTAATLTAIATVLGVCLGRPVQLSDLLMRRRDTEGTARGGNSGLAFRENIKLLELPSSAANSTSGADVASTKMAVLTDTVCLRGAPEHAAEIMFYYPGREIDGVSLSHARNAAWMGMSEVRLRESEHAPRDRFRALRLTLSEPRSDATLVQNRVEFNDGFSRPHQKVFPAHVAYPTDSLTLLVKFPTNEPFRVLRGLWRRKAGAPLLPAAEKPLALVPGNLAYWRINAARPGETYQLSWT